MCGFAVFIDPSNRLQRANLLDADSDLVHRGPDAGGWHDEPGCIMLARRLAILDPRHGADQPMADTTARYRLVYNGELYNYQRVRRQLEDEGVSFRTTGDTEVVLEALIRWGVSALERFEGMYAFALLDREERTVLAARDPLGIKPLYLARAGRHVGIGSEMRPLLRLPGLSADPDPEAIAELLVFGWAAGTSSNLAGIERVPGGTVLKIDLHDGSVSSRRWYDPLDTLERQEPIAPEDAADELERKLRESVEAHLASDVGYAVQLSGGVDSSLLTAMASQMAPQRLRTFGIHVAGYARDEQPFRDQVVDRYDVDHHELELDGLAYADALPRAIRHMEGPPPHGGDVLLMLLCDEIREHTKVVLTGEGADEFWGGYSQYKHWPRTMWQERIGQLLPHGLWPDVRGLQGVRRYAQRDAAVFAAVPGLANLARTFPQLDIGRVGARAEASTRFGHFLDRIFAVDQSAYLESCLVRQDKMSMAASVEARVPYTHLPLVEFANSIPTRLRAPGKVTKPILKEVATRYLPDDVVHRKKVGLTLPYLDWLREDDGLGRYLDDLVDPGARLGHFADRVELTRLAEGLRRGDSPLGPKHAMLLVTTEQWLRSLSQ